AGERLSIPTESGAGRRRGRRGGGSERATPPGRSDAKEWSEFGGGTPPARRARRWPEPDGHPRPRGSAVPSRRLAMPGRPCGRLGSRRRRQVGRTMALNRDKVGTTYPSYTYEVSREKIREYAAALGESDPRYYADG